MKRHNHLIEKITDMENLYLAFWKARIGKNSVNYVEEYRQNLSSNLVSLASDIERTEVSVGNYKYFKVFDPKERIISAAPFSERVLHHAIMNVCHPIFEAYQIFDSYASRLGKGTYAAIERAGKYQKKYNWFLKLDARKFFDSIDHKILYQLISKKIKDTRLLVIFEKIIESYEVEKGKGLPIGNLTSQYFANHYLAVADHFVKESLKIPAYVRYMDDMVLWHKDKKQLLEIGQAFRQFISATLDLQLKPFCLNKPSAGLPFLGYVVFPHKMHLNKNSRKRFRRKLNEYELKLNNGKWNEQEYQRHIFPLLAFAKKADSFHFRKNILNSFNVDNN